MLEIGCNVVVLSLEEYEKLKSQVRRAEYREEALQKAILFKKAYWKGDRPELSIDLKVLEPEIIQAWENYKGEDKEQFIYKGIDPEYDKYETRIDTYVLEACPVETEGTENV
jgi:hypothetical protein